MKTTMTMAIKLSSACIEVCFFVVAVAVVCLHGCISLSLFRKVALPLSIYHCMLLFRMHVPFILCLLIAFAVCVRKCMFVSVIILDSESRFTHMIDNH